VPKAYEDLQEDVDFNAGIADALGRPSEFAMRLFVTGDLPETAHKWLANWAARDARIRTRIGQLAEEWNSERNTIILKTPAVIRPAVNGPAQVRPRTLPTRALALLKEAPPRERSVRLSQFALLAALAACANIAAFFALPWLGLAFIWP